jgi:hypothetical protein
MTGKAMRSQQVGLTDACGVQMQLLQILHLCCTSVLRLCSTLGS